MRKAAGSSNPLTPAVVARFTGFWSGVDEEGMARALATERRANLLFVRLVFESLDRDYHPDADDVAVGYAA
jgi:hypothetical protein